MAKSDEMNTNHKIAVLLESLVQRQHQLTSITCHLCGQVFMDTNTLVNHLMSHSYLNGSINPNPLFQSFVPPENEIQHVTNNSHSSSAPLITRKNVANENSGLYARKTVARNPSKLLLSDSPVPQPSKKPAELIFRYHPYPSPSIFRSGSIRNQNFSFPIGPKKPAISDSKVIEGSVFCFPMKQPRFPPPTTVGEPLQSVTMKSVVLGPLAVYTKPYINQLERPIEKMKGGGDNDGDDLDLTLKL